MGDPQDCNEPEVNGGHAMGLLTMSVSGRLLIPDAKRPEHTVAVRARRTRAPLFRPLQAFLRLRDVGWKLQVLGRVTTDVVPGGLGTHEDVHLELDPRITVNSA